MAGHERGRGETEAGEGRSSSGSGACSQTPLPPDRHSQSQRERNKREREGGRGRATETPLFPLSTLAAGSPGLPLPRRRTPEAGVWDSASALSGTRGCVRCSCIAMSRRQFNLTVKCSWLGDARLQCSAAASGAHTRCPYNLTIEWGCPPSLPTAC